LYLQASRSYHEYDSHNDFCECEEMKIVRHVQDRFHECSDNLMLVVLGAKHPRLGKDSLLRLLPQDVLKQIPLLLFGPEDYLINNDDEHSDISEDEDDDDVDDDDEDDDDNDDYDDDDDDNGENDVYEDHGFY